jgi:hypothetical protein
VPLSGDAGRRWIDHLRDLADPVGREAAAAGVLEDDIGIRVQREVSDRVVRFLEGLRVATTARRPVDFLRGPRRRDERPT